MEARKLRHHRPDWIRHLRAVYRAREAARRDDDGMSHGMIPFGAVREWQAAEARRLAEALAYPLPARRVASDEMGVVLAVLCPYCQREHRHVLVTQDAGGAWEPDGPQQAGCGLGTYRLRTDL